MRLILLFVLITVLVACQDVDYASKPDRLISEDKMVNILVDLQKVEAVINKNQIQFEQRKVNAHHLIFEKYKVDSTQVAESTKYYAEDFKTNERIYDRVKTELEAQKKEVDSLYDIEKKTTEKAKAKGEK